MSQRFSKRPLVAAFAIGALALPLAACGGSSDPASPGTSESKGPVKFTWLHRLPDKAGAKTVKELVAEFNDSHPGITVVPETMQGSATESYAQINAMVEAGSDVPCLSQIGFERVPDMIPSLMDVAEYTQQYEADYVPAFYNKGKIGDAVFGLPQGASPILFFYRKDLFDEYGLTVPTTWAEYEEQATIVREKSEKKSYLGGFLTDEQMWLSALSSSAGANWFGYDPETQVWQVKVDSPEAKKVATFWEGLVDNDTVVPLQRWGQDFNKFLSDGTILSTIGGAWEAPLIADASPGGSGKWAVAQLPQFTDGVQAVGQNGGTMAAVLKGCEHPAEALEFANWFTTNVEGLTGLGLLPAAQADSIKTPEILKEYFSGQDIYDEFIIANEKAATVTWAPQISETFRVMGDSQAKVGVGSTVGDVFAAGQKAAVDSLTSVGLEVQE